MIELLGMLGGALVRLFPHFLGFLEKGRDLKYELARMEAEYKLETLRGANRVQEIEAVGRAATDTSWADALVEALKGESNRQPLKDTKNWWINLLNGLNTSVRPLITYWWCIVLHTGHKLVVISVGIQEKLPLAQFGPLLYTDFDRGVVGSIIGFWFVDRQLRQQK